MKNIQIKSCRCGYTPMLDEFKKGVPVCRSCELEAEKRMLNSRIEQWNHRQSDTLKIVLDVDPAKLQKERD